MFELGLRDIVVVVGNCGSGKTEISINLALDQMTKGCKVKIADLDLINPYFRAREVRHFLSNHDIKLALPPDKYLHADLPILTPVISGMIQNPPELLILDVGGDGIGSTVLGALSSFLKDKEVNILFVINPNRPYTSNVDNCLQMRNEIEKSAKLKISGIVGNANLMEKTNSDDIYRGYDFILKVSKIMKVPVNFITVPAKNICDLNQNFFQMPYLTNLATTCSSLAVIRTNK